MGGYLPAVVRAGVRAVLGKGELHGEDMAYVVGHRAVYFAAIGGLGALLAQQISAASVVAYDDLGPQALYALEGDAFSSIGIIDRQGANFHETSSAPWRTARPSQPSYDLWAGFRVTHVRRP